nr:immunoglobulin light chain junction region [Macaca mulatta]MOW41101.1 immunoglobulin light chain junction region [Macaca mulatta]MOW41146.1 immunoglobulin light chain junction region [Macaca mulatta]MOW41226.1 immunoglobulin light chain junction region [Macaca mulatta]MOW41495.1 immunoglobulin light chain junction region [Macaca mulatta]
CIQALQIPLTF